MKKIVIVSEKVGLTNLLKAKLFGILPESKIKLYKTVSEKITDYDVIFLDEKIARKGYKKEYKNITKLRQKNDDAKLFVIGEENIDCRLKTRVDGANEYVSLESFTSQMIDAYLTSIIST